MKKFIVINEQTPGGFQQADSQEDATTLAEQLAADNPGQEYFAFAMLSRSYGEVPEKPRVSVVTKDVEALQAEAEEAASDLQAQAAEAREP